MNPELLNLALLGTSRRPFDLTTVDPEVVLVLAAFPDATVESQVLRVAYCTLLTQYAGAEPLLNAPFAPSKPIQETSLFAPIALDELLSNIVSLQIIERNHLLPACIRIYLKNNWIVNSKFVLKLLKISAELPEKILQETMGILGERAKSLLLHFKAYQAVTKADPEIWLLGTIQQRKAHFEKLLLASRPNALALFDESFIREPVSFQRTILEVVLRSYQSSDRTKLEWLLEKRYTYREKEKSIEKSMRYLLSAQLLSDTASKIYLLAGSKLFNYFKSSKNFSSVPGFETPKLVLPDSVDDFWNPLFMEQNFGFEVQQYDIARYKNIQQFWLSEFIRFLPVNFWAVNLKLNLLETLRYFNRNEDFIVKLEGRMTAIYYPSFLENANFTKNTELSRLLIEHDKKDETGPLLGLLPHAEFEEYIRRNDFFLREDIIKYGNFVRSGEAWSVAFSVIMIQKSFSSIVLERRYFPAKILGWLMLHCDPDAESTLEYHNQLDHTSAYHHELWQTQVYRPLLNILQLKKKLKSYNN